MVDLNNLPLWSSFLFATLISFLFIMHPDYSLGYILGFNLATWGFCGAIYVSEYAYGRVKHGNKS